MKIFIMENECPTCLIKRSDKTEELFIDGKSSV